MKLGLAAYLLRLDLGKSTNTMTAASNPTLADVCRLCLGESGRLARSLSVTEKPLPCSLSSAVDEQAWVGSSARLVCVGRF